MRIVLINYGHFARQQEPEQVLDDFQTLTGWAESLQSAGAEATVVQGFSRNARIQRGGVTYEFVAGSFAPQLPRWLIPRRLHDVVRAREPEAVHLNGLLYYVQARDLRRRLPGGTLLVAQHHAEMPERRRITAAVQRRSLRSVDAFFFTGREAAKPWRERGLIEPRQQIFEIPEGSTHFRLSERPSSRASTGMRGDPVCIWLGNLTPNKDPLTVLSGFERVLDLLPDARLYMAYRRADLLSQVRHRLDSSAALGRAVSLLGFLPHKDVEAHLNSADFFLQGSHYEGSGYALIEAMACGVVPVVADIPSFRFITGSAAVGVLWRSGDSEGLRAALVEAAKRPLRIQRLAVRGFFDENLSFEVIGRRAMAAFRELRQIGRMGVSGGRRERQGSPGPVGTGSQVSGYLCPECRQPIDSATLRCSKGHQFADDGGVLVLLAGEIVPRLTSFLDVVRDFRDGENKRILDENRYEGLPWSERSDFEWRTRCYDLETLRPMLRGRRCPSVLDVGSYNGWLPRNLADSGCEVTGVDYFDDPHDGLGARRFYSCAPWFSIQLDLRDLSILNRTFDVVVLNRCLQFFSDPKVYFEHAKARVAPDGLLLATGLDFYRDPRRKERNVEILQRRYSDTYGVDFFLHPTRGLLDFADYRRLSAAGMVIRPYPQLWWRNLRSVLLPNRPRFCYGVWTAPGRLESSGHE